MRTLKNLWDNNFGVFLILVFIVATLLCHYCIVPALASGEKYVSRTFILPYNGETAKVIVLQNRDNGNAINGSTGASAAATAWNDAEITGTQHAITNDWLFTIPAHDVDRCYMKIYDTAAASVDKTTVPVKSTLYNPKDGLTYTDINPLSDNYLKTTTVQ